MRNLFQGTETDVRTEKTESFAQFLADVICNLQSVQLDISVEHSILYKMSDSNKRNIKSVKRYSFFQRVNFDIKWAFDSTKCEQKVKYQANHAFLQQILPFTREVLGPVS